MADKPAEQPKTETEQKIDERAKQAKDVVQGKNSSPLMNGAAGDAVDAVAGEGAADKLHLNEPPKQRNIGDALKDGAAGLKDSAAGRWLRKKGTAIKEGTGEKLKEVGGKMSGDKNDAAPAQEGAAAVPAAADAPAAPAAQEDPLVKLGRDIAKMVVHNEVNVLKRTANPLVGAADFPSEKLKDVGIAYDDPRTPQQLDNTLGEVGLVVDMTKPGAKKAVDIQLDAIKELRETLVSTMISRGDVDAAEEKAAKQYASAIRGTVAEGATVGVRLTPHEEKPRQAPTRNNIPGR